MPKYSHPYTSNPGGAADAPQGGAQDFAGRVDRKVEEIDRRTDEFSRSLDDIVSDLAGIGAGVGAELLDGLGPAGQGPDLPAVARPAGPPPAQQ